MRPSKAIGTKKRHHPYQKGSSSASPSKKAFISNHGFEYPSQQLPTAKVTGSGRPRAVGSLAGLVTMKKPNLVFLIETKLRKEEWEYIKRKVKLPNALVVEARGRKGGLALLWPRSLNVEIKSFSTHYIEAIVQFGDTNPWRFVGFYGLHETGMGKFSWNLMRLINGLVNIPTVFMEDFNELLDQKENVSHRRLRPSWQIQNFHQAVEDCGLLDLGYWGFSFTWCNNFISPHSTRARLDRALARKDWRVLPRCSCSTRHDLYLGPCPVIDEFGLSIPNV
ncbi:hypothetical protein LIER_42471 [Lithospermum erythrorhizon]|uniref:Uncharacterized protein n=1 Tax=Lithospermum erythrorhizon TaxID=34254 RepID=A0AAV3RQW3_LITER